MNLQPCPLEIHLSDLATHRIRKALGNLSPGPGQPSRLCENRLSSLPTLIVYPGQPRLHVSQRLELRLQPLTPNAHLDDRGPMFARQSLPLPYPFVDRVEASRG